VVNGVGGDADIGLGVVGEDRIAAVGVARAPWEIAARDVDLYAVAGIKGMVDMAEVDVTRAI
jgi:hypothetical protein